MFNRIKEWDMGRWGKRRNGDPPSSLEYCTHCRRIAGSNLRACHRCNAIKQGSVEAFDRRAAVADDAAAEIIGTLRFASPRMKAELRSALVEVLAEDFKKANSGKWKGDIAVGYVAGDFIGNLLE